MSKKLPMSSFGFLRDCSGHTLFFALFLYFLLILTFLGGGLYWWENYTKKNTDETVLDMLRQESLARVNNDLSLALKERGRFAAVDFNNLKFLVLKNSRNFDALLVDGDGDGDALSDYLEVGVYGSDPKKADTDGDTYLDGEEVEKGYSPAGEGRLPDESLEKASVFKHRLNVYAKNMCWRMDDFWNRVARPVLGSGNDEIFSYPNPEDQALAKELESYRAQSTMAERLIWQKYFLSPDGGGALCQDSRDRLWSQLLLLLDQDCSGLSEAQWAEKTGNGSLAAVLVKSNFFEIFSFLKSELCHDNVVLDTVRPSTSNHSYDKIDGLFWLEPSSVSATSSVVGQLWVRGEKNGQSGFFTDTGAGKYFPNLETLLASSSWIVTASSTEPSFSIGNHNLRVEEKGSSKSFLLDNEQVLDVCGCFGPLLATGEKIFYTCQEKDGFLARERALP